MLYEILERVIKHRKRNRIKVAVAIAASAAKTCVCLLLRSHCVALGKKRYIQYLDIYTSIGMYTLLSIAKTQQLHFSHEFIPLYVSYNCNHSHEKPLATVTQIHVIRLCVSLFILLAHCPLPLGPFARSLCIVSLYIHGIRGAITALQYYNTILPTAAKVNAYQCVIFVVWPE